MTQVRPDTEEVYLRAYAKINLTLEVLGRRPDGYHEIRSLVQTVSLHDELWFRRSTAWQVEVGGCEAPIPDNLVLRAGHALERAVSRPLPTRAYLRKRIPVGAGLGGGSSDAAATLVGLRRLWELPLRRGHLLAVAAEVGSDVPLFLRGGTLLVEGRGTRICPVAPLRRHWVVLAVASADVREKTARMYRLLRAEYFTSGQWTQAALEALRRDAEVPPQLQWNVFESVADQVFPGLSGLRESLSAAAGVSFRLSGAGPALFALLPDYESARRALVALRGQPARFLLARTCAAALRATRVFAS